MPLPLFYRMLLATIQPCLVDLPEVILEVAQHTGFFSQFTHVSDSNAHVEDLLLSLSAVLSGVSIRLPIMVR
jgi:Transposase.